MINKDALDKWLKVLRDPASRKVKGMLESVDEPNYRCCLGHLCHALGVPRHGDYQEVNYGMAIGEARDINWSQLPAYVAQQVGITEAGDFIHPVVYERFEYGSLADLNDETEITPQEIADIIEREAKAGNFHNYV